MAVPRQPPPSLKINLELIFLRRGRSFDQLDFLAAREAVHDRPRVEGWLPAEGRSQPRAVGDRSIREHVREVTRQVDTGGTQGHSSEPSAVWRQDRNRLAAHDADSLAEQDDAIRCDVED